MNHAVAAQSKFHALDPHRRIDWMLFCVVLSFDTHRGAFCCLIIFLRHPFAFMRVKVAFAQADGLWRHFDQFVIVDIGDRLFQ